MDNKLAYVDYYSVFVNEQRGMMSKYTDDGLHPNMAGYTIMENLVLPLIRKQVKKRKS